MSQKVVEGDDGEIKEENREGEIWKWRGKEDNEWIFWLCLLSFCKEKGL